METLARQLELEQHVTFVGNLNDREDFYSALDIVALTSLNEGTPLTLIEAMACGKAIVATNVGGVSDLLGDVQWKSEGVEVRERGITVASNDCESFSRALATLVGDEQLRSHLARRGPDYAVATYSKDRLIHDIISIYSHNHAPRAMANSLGEEITACES
jgi:glycosyltransferase involved in cell wall biosynthesis